MKWSIGLTTVPRRRDTLLPQSLASLRAAGFDRIRLFVDGARNDEAPWWEKTYGLEVTTRYPNLRTYGHWVLTLAEMFIREPTADRFAVFQDDLLACANLRAYLERCRYPDKGYWNLFLLGSNERLAAPVGKTGRRVEGWYESNQLGKGALGLVFDRATVLTLLTHQHMVERPMSASRGWRAVDGAVVTALRKAGWREWVHYPSLLQHTGVTKSTMAHHIPGAASFRGERFDAMGLLAAAAG